MTAARRAYWKGYLKLSLVTCPIALYSASSQAEKTHFHQISRKTGNRLRQQMVVEEMAGARSIGQGPDGDHPGTGRGSFSRSAEEASSPDIA